MVFGAALNRWTTRDSSLLQNKTVVQIDDSSSAFASFISEHDRARRYTVTAEAIQQDSTTVSQHQDRLPTPEVQERLKASLHWREQAYEDNWNQRVPRKENHPRTLTNMLDEMLPMERVVAPDGGNFNLIRPCTFSTRQSRL